MPALSITSLDRLIEPPNPSSKESASSFDQSTPFSFYPPLYATPSQQRPPSPSSFSPSPYVLNFKRRCPVQQQPNVGKEYPVDTSTESRFQEQLHRMDAIVGEGTAAVSVAPLANHAEISPDEVAMARQSGELLSENEVFEMELDKRDAVKNVPTPKDKGLLNKDNHFCNAFSPNRESGPGCQHLTVSSSVSSLAVNEEVEFFDAPDSVFPDSATEDEACSLTAKPGKCLGKWGGTTTSRLEEEVARRIKAEEIVALWQKRWNEMAKRCSSLGLSISSQNGEVLENTGDLSELIMQELMVARLVGGAIASAVVRAEKDEEFESLLAVKNREISRLCDKLQYLELVNREMSQRNQEVIELTHRRKRRQWRQKLALGGLCAACCIGTAGLVCYKFVPWDQVKGWANLFEKSSAGQSNSADAFRE